MMVLVVVVRLKVPHGSVKGENDSEGVLCSNCLEISIRFE